MKKHRLLILMFASAALLFVSCIKENLTSSDESQQSTTYTVKVSGIQVPSGLSLEFLVVEYSAINERLEINRFYLTSTTMTRNYIANSRTEKVKIAYNVVNTSTGQSESRWIQQVFYLDKGTNTNISVTGNSPTGLSEP